MTETRTNYCRVCGENKGHTFKECKNISGLRKVIALQDAERENLHAEANRLRQIDKKLDERIAENSLLHRILFSLLELVELKRK